METLLGERHRIESTKSIQYGRDGLEEPQIQANGRE